MTAMPEAGASRAVAAVVIPTVLRASLIDAARSVFAQDIGGPLHLLIGVDRPLGSRAVLDQIAAECPGHVRLTVIDPGYSTATRHGGLYDSHGGGVLRTALSYLADSRFVAYLDDDNRWTPEHLRSLRQAIDGKAWSYSFRWMIDETSGERLHVDCCKAIGPARGGLRTRGPTFIDTNTLMIDKIRVHDLLPVWSAARTPDGRGEDRKLFEALQERFSGETGATGLPTALYLKTIDCMTWIEGLPVLPSPARQDVGAVMRDLYAHAPPGAGLPEATIALPPMASAIVDRHRPRAVAVVGSGAAASAIALAALAEGNGQRPEVLWVDPGGLAAADAQGVRPPDGSPAAWPWPLVQTPRVAARFLAIHGVTLDVAWLTTGLSAARADGSLADWWALLRPGGMLVAAGEEGDGPQMAIKSGG